MKRNWLMLLMCLFTILPLASQAQFVVKEFDAPGSEPRGLAWDGQYLWCADCIDDSVFQMDPASGQVVHTTYFDFNTSNGGGVAWDSEATLWVTTGAYFYGLDAETGDTLKYFHCPGG